MKDVKFNITTNKVYKLTMRIDDRLTHINDTSKDSLMRRFNNSFSEDGYTPVTIEEIETIVIVDID